MPAFERNKIRAPDINSRDSSETKRQSPQNKFHGLKFQKNLDLQYKIPHLMKPKRTKPISERNERFYNSMPKDGTGKN